MRFPIIRQHDASDCGPAVLAMIAAWHGKRISIARIRELAGTDRRGTTLAGLIAAAQQIGFLAKGIRGTTDVFKQVALPVIAHWREDSRNHFVVVYNLDGRHFHVADPARGRRLVGCDEFHKNWTGVLLLLSQSPQLSEIINTPSSFARLCSLIRPHSRLFLDVLLAAVLMTILGLTSSFFIQALVDFVFVLRRKPALNWLGLGMLIVLLARSAFLALRTYLLAHLSQRIDADTVMGYHRHLLRLPLTFFTSRRTGEILSRWSDAVKIRVAISTTTLSIIVDTLLLITTFAAMSAMNWRVTLVSLCVLPASFGFIWVVNRPMKYHQRSVMEKAAELEAMVVEAIEGIQTIKALRAETSFRIRTETRFAEMLEASFRSHMSAMQSVVGTTFTSGAATILLLWLGGHEVLAGKMTVGQLMALNTMFGLFLAPLERLSNANQTIQDAIIAAERLGEVLDLDAEREAEHKNAIDRKIDGNVEFRDITFRYGTQRPILENVSLRVEAGECVGIVGDSGSGKTTLINLLGRFFEVEQGSILIDGIDIKEYTFDCLRREIGFVPQDIVLFNASLAENIKIARPSASVEDMHRVARQARVDEIVNRLPLGFNTFVGERGLSLSGGERQRVALARALLQDPAILVLDEPTSHLDAASEAAVESILNERRGQRTTIVISHRPLHCDRIIDFSASVSV